jgi:hypothetical protein
LEKFQAKAVWEGIAESLPRKLVSVVNDPPLLQQQIDFSKPFTKAFTFRQTVEPFCSTMYLAAVPRLRLSNSRHHFLVLAL